MIVGALPAQAARTCNSGGSYDMWLHPMSNPGGGTTPSDEVMIWTYRAGSAGPARTFRRP